LLDLNLVAQEIFDSFSAIQVVEKGHLYGGKMCAALDRQHPRDLFDIMFMLDNEVFTYEMKKGFIFYLISGERPIREILFPHLSDQSQVFKNQFKGMTDEDFSYEDYEQVRFRLLRLVKDSLTSEDIKFILSIKKGEPEWSIYNFKDFPAVQWKLRNINSLKTDNPKKYEQLYIQLELALMNIRE